MPNSASDQAELELYRSMFDLAIIGVGHIDLSTVRFTWANPPFASILGYTPEEIVGKHLSEIVHPEEWHLSKRNVGKIIDQSMPLISADRHIVRKDGSYGWISITGAVKRDAAGKPSHLICVIQDIGARKKQEFELKRTEKWLNASLDAVQDVVWSFSVPEYKMIYMNPTATRRVYHREVSEFMNNPTVWQEVVHPEDIALVGTIEPRLIANGHTEDEFRIRHPNGDVRWVQAHAWLTRDDDGKPARFEGVTRDITNSKRAELAVRESEARLRVVMETGRIGIWEMDSKSYAVKWSNVLRELLGVPEDMPAKSDDMLNLVHPDDREQYLKDGKGLVESGQEVFSPFRIVRPDGETRWLQSVGRVVRVDTTLIGAIVDITEVMENRRLMEQQRAKMIAASKMQALGEMAGGIAHEINNPVAIIHGHATLMISMAKERAMDQMAMKEAAETIARTSARIAKITRSLLAFARDADHDPFEPAKPQQILSELAEFCQERFHFHGVTFTMDPVDPKLEVQCRPVQISQVVLNLLNNAYDAVEGLPERWIRISTIDKKDSVEIRVTDSGPGIPPELRERIFQPFFTTKEVGRGTGLGLSVAKGIMESHNGTLKVDASSPNTRFVLSLPKRR